MIGEGIVLLRIQYFQESRCRIAIVGGRELIDFVQHHDRIRNTGFLNPVHDSTGHCPEIGSPMPADIRFIPHTAETDPYILPAERFCDALSDTRFTGTRRTDKEKNRAGLLFLQVHDSNLLNHSLFYLL